MSLEIAGVGAVACAAIWLYRRGRNLTLKMKDLVNLLELNESYGLVCLVDRSLTADLDKIIQTFVETTNQMTCVLHLHPPEISKGDVLSDHPQLRHVHLTTSGSKWGLQIEGSTEHRDEVTFKLFEHMTSAKYIIIDPPSGPSGSSGRRVTCEKNCDHVTTTMDLNRLLGGSIDSP